MSTGIDMNAACDTIDRSKFKSLVEEIANPDESRVVYSDTTLCKEEREIERDNSR